MCGARRGWRAGILRIAVAKDVATRLWSAGVAIHVIRVAAGLRRVSALVARACRTTGGRAPTTQEAEGGEDRSADGIDSCPLAHNRFDSNQHARGPSRV